MDGSVNPMIPDKVEDNFVKLLLTTGNKHTFLSMGVDFIRAKKVALTMPHPIDEDLEDFGENLKGNVVNPTTSQLFTITNETKYIYEKIRRVNPQRPPIFCGSWIDHKQTWRQWYLYYE